MMIGQTIFARSSTILSDQNAFLLSYNIMEEGLVKILLDQDDRANKFYPIICVFGRTIRIVLSPLVDHMIGDRLYK